MPDIAAHVLNFRSGLVTTLEDFKRALNTSSELWTLQASFEHFKRGQPPTKSRTGGDVAQGSWFYSIGAMLDGCCYNIFSLALNVRTDIGAVHDWLR
jgi:hypothetical protein